MRKLTVSLLVLSLAMALGEGCAPTKPGPISVDLSVTPSTAHPGDSMTGRVSVTNRGLDVQVSKITYNDTILSGDDAGHAWAGEIAIQDSIVPRQSTALVATETGEATDVSEQTRVRISVTVYSDGGEASDEVVVTYLPSKLPTGATSVKQRRPSLGLLHLGQSRPAVHEQAKEEELCR